LLDNLPATEIVLIARNPQKISKAWTDAGVETRYADYDKEETLKDVFVGIKHLNLISYASIEHEHRFKVHHASAVLICGVADTKIGPQTCH
jgi:uncharacterized protein YbjT (DUF2867 family)